MFMLTAPGREAIAAGTLQSWAAAGGGEPPVLHIDPTPRQAPAISRIMGGWRSLLERAAAESTDGHWLCFEDDLHFAPGFMARIAAWPPLVDGRLRAFGSFFNPGVLPAAS